MIEVLRMRTFQCPSCFSQYRWLERPKPKHCPNCGISQYWQLTFRRRLTLREETVYLSTENRRGGYASNDNTNSCTVQTHDEDLPRRGRTPKEPRSPDD